MKERFIRQGDTHILYDGDAAPRLAPDWFDRGALERAGAVERETTGGRVPAVFFTAADGDFVLKHYRRGGWPGRFVRDAYCYAGETAVRSFHEWRLLAELRRLGLPAPAPCAARYRRRAGCYTADLITFRCPDTRPLSQVLMHGRLPAERWRAIGAVLRRFHDAGVWHADLNAHNVLLGEETAAIFLVDFDRGRIGEAGNARLRRNLSRLKRSLVKLQGQSAELAPDFIFKEEDFFELLEGYG